MNDKIELVISRFDFETVAKVMQFLNWEWAIAGKMKVPNAHEIESSARSLLKVCTDEKYPYASSGGLTAELLGGDLFLYFNLEMSDSCYE